METLCAISIKKKSLFLGLVSDTQGQAGFLWTPTSLQASLLGRFAIWNPDIFKYNPRYAQGLVCMCWNRNSADNQSKYGGYFDFFWQTHWIFLSKHFLQLSLHSTSVLSISWPPDLAVWPLTLSTPSPHVKHLSPMQPHTGPFSGLSADTSSDCEMEKKSLSSFLIFHK